MRQRVPLPRAHHEAELVLALAAGGHCRRQQVLEVGIQRRGHVAAAVRARRSVDRRHVLAPQVGLVEVGTDPVLLGAEGAGAQAGRGFRVARRALLGVGRALGHRKAVILKNHGILTAGPSVESAAWWYIALENACQAQLLAEAAGTPTPIAHDVATLTHAQIGNPGGAHYAFQSLYDIVVRQHPEVLQ
ncbi:MAG: hypothetical protein EOP37_27710 [Rubrivivax sp.]|nr:MAG: hypothetical protein EOP37_27710 [Rubrivivax sp.]